MTRITGLRTFDLRFPTSQSLDGSDAMNPDPDYSAAYVILDTRQRHRGARADLHDRARQRHLLRRDRGDAASGGRARARLGEGKSRPLLASPHRRQPVALDRPGQGRHASRHRRGGQRRLGSVGQGSRQAGVAAGRRDEPGRAVEDRRLPLPHRRADAGRSARHLAPRRAGQGRAHRHARARGLCLLHDLGRLARLSRRQAAPALPGGGRRRLQPHQDEGRPRPRRRHPAARPSRAR